MAPRISSSGVGDYLCVHHTLLAHAKSYHLYKDKYFDQQGGLIGFCSDVEFLYPFNSTVDQNVIEKGIQFGVGRYGNPLFKGGYPQIMVDEIERRSFNEGRERSRLPVMSEEEKNFIRGTVDFLAINYYTSRLVYERDQEINQPGWSNDNNLVTVPDSKWKKGKSSYIYNVPQGLRDILVWIKNNYDNPAVMITENGWCDEGELEDNDRLQYVQEHLAALSKAINEDHCNVVGYTAWSLLDNFEWLSGYTEKFGIHYVNFQSEAKERIPKKSALFFKEFMKTKSFDIEKNVDDVN